MTGKESVKKIEEGPAKEKNQPKRYTRADKKISEKPNESETGIRHSRGKKQRRQYKLAPNRG